MTLDADKMRYSTLGWDDVRMLIQCDILRRAGMTLGC